MDRRNFFKIISATSAGVVTSACGSKTDQLIPLLVPEDDLVPGLEQWHPAVCTECGGGCGTLVRIMEGSRVIEQNGEKVRERRAAIKKIEGNPLDPVSGGRLCARGQAVVQALYHPDRLRSPMKRSGDRGKAEFAAISWDEALGAAAESIARVRTANPTGIVILTGSQIGTRSLALERFAEALGAPAPVVCSLDDLAVERKAAEIVFGWQGLPVYDLAKATYALGVGADFLGGWASPVYYARQFGAFRQGRTGIRGHLIQAESRLSLTASSADKWLPVRPGTEPQFLAVVGRMLLDANLARNRDGVPKAALAVFQSADVSHLLETCGLEERKVRPLVVELGESDAPVILGGASIVQSNSLASVVASHYLNMLLGNIGKPGGVLPPGARAVAPIENHHVVEALAHAQVVLVDDSNPAYTLPQASGVSQALVRAQTVISLGPFIDDTSAWADLLLPANHGLESEAAIVPSVAAQAALAMGAPFVRALHDTRPLEQILSQLAERIKVEYKPATARELVEPLLPADVTFDQVVRQGGLWGATKEQKSTAKPRETTRTAEAKLEIAVAKFAGDAGQFPLYFQPYLSLQFHDGRASNLPWMQELPDPASSAMWGLPVEVDPKTAAALGIVNGDRVRVESAHGAIEMPAYVHPGAIPGVLSMGIGDGHTHYGRYASGRGANPIAILDPTWEESTGALVLGGTRVRLTRAGEDRRLVQYSRADREQRDFSYR